MEGKSNYKGIKPILSNENIVITMPDVLIGTKL
jgi:hypothetical protein